MTVRRYLRNLLAAIAGRTPSQGYPWPGDPEAWAPWPEQPPLPPKTGRHATFDPDAEP